MGLTPVELLVVVVALVGALLYWGARHPTAATRTAAACLATEVPGSCGRGPQCSHHSAWRWDEEWGWWPRGLPIASRTDSPSRNHGLGQGEYSDAAQDGSGWWHASHFAKGRRTTVGPFLDRDQAMNALRTLGYEPTAQIAERRLVGPATHPAFVDDRYPARSSFIKLLRAEVRGTLRELDDGKRPLVDVFEGAVSSGAGTIDRFISVEDGSGTMTSATARRLAVGVLWDEAMTRAPYADCMLKLPSLRPAGIPVEWNATDDVIGESVRALLLGKSAEAPDARVFDSIIPRLVEVAREAMLSTWAARPWARLWAEHPETHGAADAITEVGFSESTPMAIGGYAVTLRRDGSAGLEDTRSFGTCGPHAARFDPSAFSDLARMLVLLGIDRLEGVYTEANVFDAGSSSIWIARGDARLVASSYGHAWPDGSGRPWLLLRQAVDGIEWQCWRPRCLVTIGQDCVET